MTQMTLGTNIKENKNMQTQTAKNEFETITQKTKGILMAIDQKNFDGDHQKLKHKVLDASIEFMRSVILVQEMK
jgi:hypothetical protein